MYFCIQNEDKNLFGKKKLLILQLALEMSEMFK